MTEQKKRSIASVRWVNIRLTDNDKELLRDREVNVPEVLARISDLMLAGYRLSVSFDDYSQAMQASLVCADDASPDYGCGMSARHPDLDLALLSLLYKATVLVKPGHWHERLDKPRFDSWS